MPGVTTPTPQAAAALSPAPPGDHHRAARRPSARASSGRSSPDGALPSTSRGMCDARQPGRLEQVVRPVARADVEPEGARRRPTSPRRGGRSAAGGRSPWAAAPCRCAAKTSGSCLRSQAIFGAVKPGMAMLPATSRARGKAASISAHSAMARPSFQRIAGRSTRSSWSRQTAPCICPERPMPRRPGEPVLARERADRSPRPPRHQSSGSCSDQPGCGRDDASALWLACPISRWSRSKSTVLTEEVPMSMPRYMRRRPPASRAGARSPRPRRRTIPRPRASAGSICPGRGVKFRPLSPQATGIAGLSVEPAPLAVVARRAGMQRRGQPVARPSPRGSRSASTGSSPRSISKSPKIARTMRVDPRPPARRRG